MPQILAVSVVVFTYFMRLLGMVSALALLDIGTSAANSSKLLRSLSGASGKTVGADFVSDETRNRFVFPNDNSLVIYFQWEMPPGDHVLGHRW